MSKHRMGKFKKCSDIKQSDRKMIGDRRRTCLQSDHGHETTWKRRRWIDALDRDMKIVGPGRKMAYDRRRWQTTIDVHRVDTR